MRGEERIKHLLEGDVGQGGRQVEQRLFNLPQRLEDSFTFFGRTDVRYRLTAEEFRRLVHAVSVNVGIEALVTLVDLAGLSREEAAEVMRWSARSLLRAALAGGGSDG
jgi:hypothetical protein